jgi:hypothetical protein
LAESNLFLIAAQGPGSLSFNEFNPIFNRNGATAQFSVLAGENDTIGGELVLSAIQNRLSWSFGFTLFDTDGWRENADQDDKIANAFVQYELSYKTSIQAEYRYRETERGDLRLRSLEDDFFETQRQDEEKSYYRIGGRHSWTPSNITLVNFTYQDAETIQTFDQDDLAAPFTSARFEDPDQDAYSSELQHLFRSQYLDTVGGGGYFHIDSRLDLTVGTPFPPPLDQFRALRVDQDLKHYNVYVYNYLKLLDNLTFTVGASGDFLRADDNDQFLNDKDKVNPKFGVVWDPFSGTTLRGAAFRTLKRTLITDQTLEPTQVAGFNQFFDDLNGTEAWVYGVAWDQKFPKNIYFGLEGNYRDLEIPYIFSPAPGAASNEEENGDEYTGRAYLFWTPHDWIALRVEGLYEKFETNGNLNLPENVETYRVPVGINFFHPSGLSALLSTTYYDQEGQFVRANGTDDRNDDTFWLADAAIRYRFPKRYGFFTIGATNLFDEDFDYFDTDVDNPAIQPDRYFFASITLAVP